MPMGNVGETVGGMFSDLKSRLGFDGGDDRRDDRRDDHRDDRRYDRREEYAYDDGYDDYDEYKEYGESYDENAPVGGYRPLSTSTARPTSSRYASSDISSSLVSINDVKATTPIPDLYDREPLSYAPERNENADRTNRASRDDAGDPSLSLPTYIPMPMASTGTSNTSSTSSTAYSAPSSRTMPSTGSYGTAASEVTASAGAGSYDPYEAYSSANPASHTPVRSITIVKPVVYGDVERVARALKSGDVVVLVMSSTPDDLSKRVLDFSFGVASALDANVECPGDKIFAIARGNALTEEEKRRLRAQGVL